MTALKKRSLTALFALFFAVILASVMSASALAADPFTMNFSKTTEIKSNQNGSLDLSTVPSDVAQGTGTVSYDAASNTITLDNVTWKYDSDTWFIDISSMNKYDYKGEEVNVVFKGTNKITGYFIQSFAVSLKFTAFDENSSLKLETPYYSAIDGYNASIILNRGTYSFNNTDLSDEVLKVVGDHGDVKITDGAVVDAHSSAEEFIDAQNNVLIDGGSVVTVTSDKSSIWSGKGIKIADGATLNVTCLNPTNLTAVRALEDIEVSGVDTKLTVNAQHECLNANNVTISDAQVKLHSQSRYAVYATNNISINSAKMVAENGNLNCPVFGGYGNLTVDGETQKTSAVKYKKYASPADYTAVDAALETVPTDMTDYSAESVEAVNNAVAAVERGKGFDEQEAVDAMAKAINDAVAALQYKPADYTEVDKAIASIPEDMSKYTDETAEAVANALAAVNRDLDFRDQQAVDAMAQAINDAVKGLEEKPVAPDTDTTKPGDTDKPAPDTDTTKPGDTDKPAPDTDTTKPGETDKPAPEADKTPQAGETDKPAPEADKLPQAGETDEPAAEADKLPQTGDTSNVGLFGLISLVAFAGMGLTLGLRKKAFEN